MFAHSKSFREKTLITAIQSGDTKSFEELVQKLKDKNCYLISDKLKPSFASLKLGVI
jgi:hypothetical protein